MIAAAAVAIVVAPRRPTSNLRVMRWIYKTPNDQLEADGPLTPHLLTACVGRTRPTMTDAANVFTVDHTGFAVSSLEAAVRFWTGALGFTLERQSEMGGEFLHQVTGVVDPSVKTAIVKAPDGYVVELLEYSTGFQNGKVPDSAGSIGAAHLALTVEDIHAAIRRVEAAGWKAKGSPLPIPGGPREGTLVAYVSGPDHVTIELMQPPVR
jgi:catechol 2,3-dioxygenase-like lactoylglutathione lyase family enzyme